MAATATTVEQSTAAPPGRGRLLQVLGVAFGVAVIIGNTIGSGILRTPGTVAALLPNQRAVRARVGRRWSRTRCLA